MVPIPCEESGLSHAASAQKRGAMVRTDAFVKHMCKVLNKKSVLEFAAETTACFINRFGLTSGTYA